MKALIPLLLVSTSALAVTTVQFAHRASTERKRADEAVALTQKSEARIRELEKARSALDRQLMEAQRPAMANVPTPSGDASTGVARTLQPIRQRAGVPVATAVAQSGGFTTVNLRPWSQQTQQSPAAQRYSYWQRKASLRRQYEDLGPALALSQAQADKLIDVLANQQFRPPNQPVKAGSDRAAFDQAFADMKNRTDAEVAAVIGEDKLPQWQQYQKTMPERTRVNMVAEQLRIMDVPLTDYQRSQLVDIMIQQGQQLPLFAPPQEGLSPEEMMNASMKREEESDKAFLESAQSVLTRDQYERYRDYQAWQREMRANSMRYVQSATNNGQILSSQTFVAPANAPQ